MGIIAQYDLTYQDKDIHQSKIMCRLHRLPSNVLISDFPKFSTIVTYLKDEKSSKSFTLISEVDPFTIRDSPVTPRGMSGGKIDEKPLVNTVSPAAIST